MADRRELLDYTHALAHYISRGLPVQWDGTREARRYVLSFTVDGDRFWRVVSETQDIRDAVRRGRYSGVLLTDRPITLERYDPQTTHWLLEQHEILREMLVGGKRFFVWTRAATTGQNELVDIRRYAYEPDEFQRRVKDAEIEVPPVGPTSKRDMRRPWR